MKRFLDGAEGAKYNAPLHRQTMRRQQLDVSSDAVEHLERREVP
jgi:hypothetical protein